MVGQITKVRVLPTLAVGHEQPDLVAGDTAGLRR